MVTTSSDATKNFWQWFEKNSPRLWAYEKDEDKILDELERELSKVDDGFRFEIGPIRDGRREITISAGGIARVFPAVKKLVAAAPKLHNWTVVAFRQPKDIKDFKLQFNGVELSKDDLWFETEKDGDKFGLRLFIRGYKSDKETETVAGASFLFLDMTIGEYLVETRLSWIERKPLPVDPKALKLKPLIELKAIVDPDPARN